MNAEKPILKTDRKWGIWYAWYGTERGGIDAWLAYVRPTFSRGLTKRAAIRRAKARLCQSASA